MMAERQKIQKGKQDGEKPRRGLRDVVRALFPPKHEKEKGIAITPEIDARLQELGLGRRRAIPIGRTGTCSALPGFCSWMASKRSRKSRTDCGNWD